MARLSSACFLLPCLGLASLSGSQSSPVERPRLYVVGYSHLDTQWCWTYPQVIREFIPNTLHENFALFEKYPNYVFNWTGSNRYRMIKEYYPKDYAKLKEYIKKGRWVTAGSSVEEGDVNSPSEESLIRQVMYGNQFFRREFGTESSEFMLPDCFGFPASLPSILAHCGLNGFSTQKLSWGSAVGIPFNVGRWIGPDGTSVVAALNATSYTSNIDNDLSRDAGWTKRVMGNPVPVDFRYYGSGDRGGAPQEDSVKRLEATFANQGPLRVIGGRADQLFNQLTSAEIARLKTYRGDLELTQHSAGSLTSEAMMKRWNRKNEVLAEAAEKSSSMAELTGALPYDRARLTDAWLRFLPGQFHDLLAGTALPLAYNYTWNDEIIAMNEFADVLQGSVGALSRSLDTRGTGVPIVVYNPLSITRDDTVTADVIFPGPAPAAVTVANSSGTQVPAQLVSRQGNMAKIIFLAKVPSLGLATFHIKAGHSGIKSELKITANSLENARYRVTLDAAGDIAHVYDKNAKRDLLSAPARLAFQYEKPRDWPAWNMDWEDQSKPPRGYVSGHADFKIVEQGAARIGLQVTRESEGSTFIQTIRLAAGSGGNRLDVELKADWRGKETVLKATFPLTVSNPEATYNWELGTVRRGNNEPKKYEVAAHRWFDVTDKGGSYGVSVLDDCKYGSDKPSDNLVRLSLIYTPGTRDGYQHQGTQDWGKHDMVYSLFGHSGSWGQTTQWQANRLNQPLLGFQVGAHPGKLGKTFSFAKISTPQLALSTFKKAEDSDEWIVRINELEGKVANGKITFAGPVISAREVDGQERSVGPAKVSNGSLVVSTTAYHPKAYAIRIKSPRVNLKSDPGISLALPTTSNVAVNFDGHAQAMPGELLPNKIVSGGLKFLIGGGNNVVTCSGQEIPLPKSSAHSVSLLVASDQSDMVVNFSTGKEESSRLVQAWNGFVGQWDSRNWQGEVPELTYGWDNKFASLTPGYIKRSPVAWYADHIQLAGGKVGYYNFCYLFRISVSVAKGAKSLKLPTNPHVKVISAVLGDSPVEDVQPVQPLYDVRTPQQ